MLLREHCCLSLKKIMKAKETVRKWRLPFACTLLESVMSTEVESALTDWIKNTNTDDYVLIGGLVVGYYTRPRMTQDVDVLYFSSIKIPINVQNFKHHRSHAFEHRVTGVEVEALDAAFLKIDQLLVDHVFRTSIVKDGVRIASPEGLIAMKIGRSNFRDIADIDDVATNHSIDLTGWPLDTDKLLLVEQKLGYSLRNNK